VNVSSRSLKTLKGKNKNSVSPCVQNAQICVLNIAQKRLAAGPAGEITALPPDPVAGLSGNGGEGRKGCGRKRKRGEIKERGGKRGERTLSPHFRFSGFARAVF